MNRTALYWFNWPSDVGGADTKFVHLLPLLADEFDIIVVPNDVKSLENRRWIEYLEKWGVRAVRYTDLPVRIDGWAVALCNGSFFKDGKAAEMKRRGAQIAWSNEMMWHFEDEVEAVASGLIDRVMYVSPVQRAALEPGYRRGCEAPLEQPGLNENEGVFPRHGTSALEWVMTGNWIDPSFFPFRQRGLHTGGPFTVGRLSRPDPDKFPDDFPMSYEGLNLQGQVRYRVMGWSDKLAERWSEHTFDEAWNLLPPASEPASDFLNSLDLFVYDLSPRFQESWGRAVVEAMLCGAVPILPWSGLHHFENVVQHGISGFLCRTREEFGNYARALQADTALLSRVSLAAREDACRRQCDPEVHRRAWRRVFL